MPRSRLTAAAIERLRPPDTGQVEHFDALLPSFGLRISYSGTRAWFVTTRVQGKLVRITLGRYPGMSLSEARRLARETIDKARAGIDVRASKQSENRRKIEEQQKTFSFVVDKFFEERVDIELSRSTAREYQRLLRGTDTESWRNQPISSISRAHVQAVLQGMRDRGAPSSADRSLAYLSSFFNWAVDQDHLEVPPTARIRRRPNQSRERVLSADELYEVKQALNEWNSIFAPLFKVLLLTGQRRNEVAKMRWEELRNLGLEDAMWHLPAPRVKNRQGHLVPLLPEVQDTIQSCRRLGPLVFSAQSAAGPSGFSKAKKVLDARIADGARAAGRPPVVGWTLHDLRRTMVTVMNENLSVAPHVAEAIVNHKSGAAKRGVAGVYNRALYMVERRGALEKWERFVADLAPLSPTTNDVDCAA